MNPAERAMKEWQDIAIEKCRRSQSVYDAGLCYICMRPAGQDGCAHFRTVEEAREAMNVVK